jgi:bifunctional enzyme CysN/CysC
MSASSAKWRGVRGAEAPAGAPCSLVDPASPVGQPEDSVPAAGRLIELAEQPLVATAKPLHLATVGSVDDGKSTLIGRLLHDSKSIFEDQLEHIEAVSRRRGDEHVDLALLTDGLRAEREQGITIDVAYRYFSTPRRDFVIADCPGHLQYTRNMVTGVSRADLAIVLVDARHGIVEQTRRHTLIATLLRVPHLVIAVNKMDLVEHAEARFDEIREEFALLANGLDLDVGETTFVPISALAGDNVVERSDRMPWYRGLTLLDHLESVAIADTSAVGARFPVQFVIRPQRAEHRDYRGYAGTVAAGTLRTGDAVVVLPSGIATTIAAIDTADGPVDEAAQGRAVTVVLADEVDVSRGDVIVDAADAPDASQRLTATLAWLDGSAPLAPRATYQLKHTTRSVRAIVTNVQHRIDIEQVGMARPADRLALNEVGVVTLRTTEPVFVDDYRRSRSTGSFVLIDEMTNQTVAAGMVTLGTT